MSPGLLFNQEFGDVILVGRARERRVGGSLGEGALVLFNQGCQSSGVDASRKILPWLDLIASGTAVSLDPKGRWDGTLVPLWRHAWARGFIPAVCWGGRRLPKRHLVFVRKSDLSLEQLANVFSCVCLGEQRPTVVGMEIRDLNLKDPWVKTFGTIDGGLVWFAVRRCQHWSNYTRTRAPRLLSCTRPGTR